MRRIYPNFVVDAQHDTPQQTGMQRAGFQAKCPPDRCLNLTPLHQNMTCQIRSRKFRPDSHSVSQRRCREKMLSSVFKL